MGRCLGLQGLFVAGRSESKLVTDPGDELKLQPHLNTPLSDKSDIHSPMGYEIPRNGAIFQRDGLSRFAKVPKCTPSRERIGTLPFSSSSPLGSADRLGMVYTTPFMVILGLV